MSSWRFDPKKALAPDECRRLFAAAQDMAQAGRAQTRPAGFRRARDGHLILFLFATGCRVSEALATEIQHVRRIAAGRVEVRLKRCKDRDGPAFTWVDLDSHDGDDLLAWIRWLKAKGAGDACALFPRGRPDGRAADAALPILRQSGYTVVKRTLRQIGIDRDGVGVHAIRHGVGITTYRATKNIRVVQARLRHSRVSTTEIYAKIVDEDVTAGVSATRAFLEGEDG